MTRIIHYPVLTAFFHAFEYKRVLTAVRHTIIDIVNSDDGHGIDSWLLIWLPDLFRVSYF